MTALNNPVSLAEALGAMAFYLPVAILIAKYWGDSIFAIIDKKPINAILLFIFGLVLFFIPVILGTLA